MEQETGAQARHVQSTTGNTNGPSAFITMPVQAAREAKFKIGRVKHGPIFLRDPLLECYEEMLDGLNYMDEYMRRNAGGNGNITSAKLISYHIHSAAVKLKQLHAYHISEGTAARGS